MKYKKSSEIDFLLLLKAGIWEDIIKVNGYGLMVNDKSKTVDYDEVLRIAEEQSVVGLVFAGIQNTGISIPLDKKLKFAGRCQLIEERNVAMNRFICELLIKLEKAGVNAVLVKGQGIAQCYERPLWRICGDVDLLLDNENFEKAKKQLFPLAQKLETESNYAKHLGMTIGQWVVELHGTLRCGLSPKIDKLIDDLQYESCNKSGVRIWNNGGVDVILPEVNNDIIFVFTHFLNHFYKGGIGFKQICDWCRLLWNYKEEIDVGELKKRLITMNLTSEWKAFSSFAVMYLGMPENAMPLYENKTKWMRKATRIKKFINEVGNMGQNRDFSYYKKHSFWIRKLISLHFRLKDAIRHFTLFPFDSFCFTFSMIRVGFRNSFSHN